MIDPLIVGAGIALVVFAVLLLWALIDVVHERRRRQRPPET